MALDLSGRNPSVLLLFMIQNALVLNATRCHHHSSTCDILWTKPFLNQSTIAVTQSSSALVCLILVHQPSVPAFKSWTHHYLVTLSTLCWHQQWRSRVFSLLDVPSHHSDTLTHLSNGKHLTFPLIDQDKTQRHYHISTLSNDILTFHLTYIRPMHVCNQYGLQH